MSILAKAIPGTGLLPLPLLTLCLSLLTPACAVRKAPRWPQENLLVVALENPPVHLDPRVGTDQASSRVFEVILNGLVTKDSSGNLVPDLAASWEVLDEGKRYRFRLRSDVCFHDGRPLTSADVVWTFGTIVDGTVATAKRAAFVRLQAVEAVDPLTVDFVLSEPFGPFLLDLTPSQGVIPRGTTPEEMNARPVGTGPFRVVRRRPDELILERFDAYWGGPAPLERLVFRVVPDATVRALELLKGSVQLVVNDLSPDVIPLFRASPHYRVVEDPGANYAYLGLNLEDPILSDVRVRRALAHAIHRQRLVDTLWRGLGVVTETILPPGHWARHEGLQPIPYDPAAARRLLDEAGYPDPDGEGPQPRFILTYKTSTNEPYVLQAQIIQEMARQAGIGLEIRSYEFATFYEDIRKGNFQLFSLVRTGVADPHIFHLILHSESLPPKGQNRGRYQNPEFDRLIAAGARRVNPQDRLPYYLKAQEIFARDLPYISLYTKVNVAVMPAVLDGYQNYPSGEFYSLKNLRWRR